MYEENTDRRSIRQKRLQINRVQNDLTINTLENAIYMNVQNDLSFIIDSRLSLYEHQSTYNPNMLLRFLIYLANLYADMVKGMNLYGSKTIPLPAPKFIVFYNGLKSASEKRADEERKRADAAVAELAKLRKELQNQ